MKFEILTAVIVYRHIPELGTQVMLSLQLSQRLPATFAPHHAL